MPSPLTQEQIKEAKEAVVLHERLKLEPDIIAYRHRRRVRGAVKAQETLAPKRAKVREARIQAIKHRAILCMTKGKTSVKAIAEELQVPPTTVKAVIEHKSFNKSLNTYQNGVLASARAKMEEKLDRLTDKLLNIAERGRPAQRLQFEAIKDIMDRCGMKPPEVKEIITRQYTPEETASMLQTAKEVEEITKNLSKAKSPYLLEKPVCGKPS